MVSRIKSAFHGENSMRGATALLMVTLFLSNILGFLRDRFLAQKLPAEQADMYFNAFRLPDLVFNVLILGAVSTAFIPIFTDYLFKNKDEGSAWRLSNTVFNLSAILLIIFLAGIYFAAPVVVPLISPFSQPDRVETTILLTRVLLIQPFFFGLSYIAGSLLNSFKRFGAYAIAPLIYNTAIIISILYLTPIYGAKGVVYGVLVGAFLHFLVQVPTLVTLGYRYRPIIDFKMPALRQIAALMWPRALQLLLLQLVLLAFARFSAQLSVGSVSSLNYADNIQTVPTVIFGNALAMASFPYMSEAFAKGEGKDFRKYLVKATKAALFFLIPSAVGLYLLRVQIVRLILGSGHFGWDQTIMTAEALGMFALGLVPLGLIPLYLRAFFAAHDTRTPALITLPIVIFSILFGYILAFHTSMGVAGLALAFSVSSTLQLIVLYAVLRRRFGWQDELELVKSLAVFVLMGLIMAVAIQLVKMLVGSSTDLRYGVNVLMQGATGVLVGAVVYLGLALILRIPEIEFLWKRKKIFSTN